MTRSIVYTSKTGNTEQLAKKIKAVLPDSDCIYLGQPDALAADADVIFAGFWTDKGSCGQEMEQFLKSIHGKQVYLFGTAGFGGGDSYFLQILSRVKLNIDSSNKVIGTFMCQGKMMQTVRQRYEDRFAADPKRLEELLHNFDQALSHPDQRDLTALEQSVQKAISKLFPQE